MNIDFASLSASERYHTMVQTLIPRPIAWVLSENANQRFNLAPFSYFSAVSSEPPLLMISVGKKPDGSFKDTRVNIEQRQHFVVHIPQMAQAESVNASSAVLPAEVSELETLNLPTESFTDFKLPRLRDCPVAFACKQYAINEIGETPMSLILGEIVEVYIDDRVIDHDASKDRLKVNAEAINPLARLGGIDYCGISSLLSIKRP